MSKSIPEITLNDGLVLPTIGFGTYKLNGNEGANAIKSAIDVGYRLLIPLIIMKMKEPLERPFDAVQFQGRN